MEFAEETRCWLNNTFTEKNNQIELKLFNEFSKKIGFDQKNAIFFCDQK